jgi:hypothetical protein
MKLGDLIQSKDGSLSMTKLAASTFHFLLAVFVSIETYKFGFDITIWGLYGAFAVGHAGYDKTMAVVKDFKDKAASRSAPQ